jgi:tryptophan-rich sensory protein
VLGHITTARIDLMGNGLGMNLPVIVATTITLMLLTVGGLTTTVGDWYRDLRKPPWNPPNWLFGPAWTVILGLAAWAGVLAWNHAYGPANQLLVAGLLWSPLFFNMRRPDWALLEVPFLWLSVLALMVGLARYSVLASLLLAPYLLWVGFAAFLNLVIVRMNAPFGATSRKASEAV